PVMSWINLGEVSYIVERKAGAKDASQVVRDLHRRLTLDLLSEARVLQAARIKARYPVAYADAFAVATAIAHHATLLTGDPEILDGDPTWPTADLRLRASSNDDRPEDVDSDLRQDGTDQR
ncbi:MAG: type II toxin-antitoxin system VapC family toxin, partial [Acidimicrobiales bacterium]